VSIASISLPDRGAGSLPPDASVVRDYNHINLSETALTGEHGSQLLATNSALPSLTLTLSRFRNCENVKLSALA